MGRGRKPGEGLRWHSGHGQWYRVIDGKQKRFGPRGRKGKEPDQSIKAAAERAWHQHEAERLSEAARPSLAPVVQNVALAFDMLQRKGAAELALQGAKTSEEIEEIRQALVEGLAALQPKEQSPNQDQPKGPTCKQVVEVYLDFLRENRSQEHHRDAIGRLGKSNKGSDRFPTWLDFIGSDTPIRALTRKHFTDYRDKVNAAVKAGRLSQSSANKMFRLVKGAFNRAAKEKGWTALELSAYLMLLETKQTAQTNKAIFSQGDWKKIEATLDVKWKAISYLALNCALSNTDIAELSWTNINWTDKYLDYTRAKNNRQRKTPLWSRTLKALKAYKATIETEPVFLSDKGGPLISFTEGGKNDLLSQAFRKQMKALGLSYTFGTFRKSAATIAKRAVDADGVNMLLGDASPGVWSKHYVMTYPENVAKATAEIEAYYF